MSVEIAKHGTEIRDQFLAKMSETFDADAVERKARCWDWIFNPAAGPDAPAVYVFTAWHNGEFVGGSIQGVAPYIVRGQRRFIVMPFGTNIDPAIRGLGIKLVKTLYDGSADRIGIPISDQFARVNDKFGALRLSRVQILAPLRPGSALARRKPAAAALAGPVNAIWSVWRKALSLRGARLAKGETITDAHEFGEEHDVFWSKALASQVCIRVRDAAYMKWRFLDMPLQKYDVLQLRRDGELRGYVAVGHTITAERGTGQITDILTIDDDPRDLELLFRAAHERLYNLGAEVAAFGCVQNEKLIQGAKRTGFLRIKPTRPAQFLLTDVDRSNDMLADAAHIYMTRADQDEDF